MSYRYSNNGNETCWPGDCEMVRVKTQPDYWREECRNCGSSSEWFSDTPQAEQKGGDS